MSPARAASLMQPVIVLMAGLFVIALLIGWISNDDYEDEEFTVTITYNCERVIAERNYPPEVLTECLELRDELARKNR